jgi:hypothetical protein
MMIVDISTTGNVAPDRGLGTWGALKSTSGGDSVSLRRGPPGRLTVDRGALRARDDTMIVSTKAMMDTIADVEDGRTRFRGQRAAPAELVLGGEAPDRGGEL